MKAATTTEDERGTLPNVSVIADPLYPAVVWITPVALDRTPVICMMLLPEPFQVAVTVIAPPEYPFGTCAYQASEQSEPDDKGCPLH